MMSRRTISLSNITSPQEGVQALLDEYQGWLNAVFEKHMQMPWQGIHDEATFITAWAPYYALTGDKRALQLALKLRDRWLAWAETHFYHGYHPKQEAHHGPEHFLIFLDWLHQIGPDDEITKAAILDAAHHIGNWEIAVPPWYNWQRHRFVSNAIGSQTVGDEGLNIIEHLRFVHLALTAYQISGESRYFDFAVDYAAQWAAEILNNETAPLYLDADSEAHAGYETILNTYLGAAPKDFSPLSRAENHVANGTPQLFIKLWQLSGDDRFAEAAKKLILALQTELADPDASPVAHLFSQYRHLFNDTTLDQAILDSIGPCPALGPTSLQLQIDTEMPRKTLRGIGKRSDMPTWVLINDGKSEVLDWPSPAALALAHEIGGSEEYAIAATSLALAKFRLARQVYRDGRYHGCTARSVAAICRGHGRCWGIGDVSGVLVNPAILQAYGVEPHSLVGIITN